MNYVAILAGGVGNRINCLDYPKQFYKINDKPIIIYTIEKFVKHPKVDIIFVATNENYYEYTKEMLIEYNLNDKVILLKGGSTRMNTIDNVIKKIEETNKINDNDLILIHDAVRPFVTNKIINDSFEKTKEYGATVATISVVDTIVASENGNKVDYIPKRSELFAGQSPDTFRLKEFIDMKKNLTKDQKEIVTGTSQIYTLNNRNIYMIEGDPLNFKITTDLDLKIAEKIVMEGMHEENC